MKMRSGGMGIPRWDNYSQYTKMRDRINKLERFHALVKEVF